MHLKKMTTSVNTPSPYPIRLPDTLQSDLLLVAIALFLPPIPVYIRKGCSAHLILNLALFLLAWIPGVLHAWYVIFVYDNNGQKKRDKRVRQKKTGAWSQGSATDEKRDVFSTEATGMGNQQGYYGPPPESQQQQEVVQPSDSEIQQVQARQEPPEYARDVKQIPSEMQSPYESPQPPAYPSDVKQ